MKHYQGFTLIELMITVTILALVMMMGIPNLQRSIIQNRLTTTANNFISDFSFARLEAIRRTTRVSICKTDDGIKCKRNIPWNSGRLVFLDVDNLLANQPGNIIVPPDGSVIRVMVSDENGLSISANSNIDEGISFIGTGEPRGDNGGFANGTITICHSAAKSKGSQDYMRAIVMSNSGRTYVKKDELDVNTCP